MRSASLSSLAFVAPLALSAFFTPACASTRQITPWLKTSRAVPVERTVGPGALRYERDAWVTIPGLKDQAFGFAGGSRAVVLGDSLMLVRPDGPPARLPCDSEARGTPDGKELLCIERIANASGTGTPRGLRVSRINADGAIIEQRDAPYPVLISGPQAPQTATDGDVSFVGFAAEGLVFAVLVDHADEDHLEGRVLVLQAYLLGKTATWRDLGSLRIAPTETSALHFPRLWNERNGLQIEPGRFLQDTRGQPEP